jgi:hypothetical protein
MHVAVDPFSVEAIEQHVADHLRTAGWEPIGDPRRPIGWGRPVGFEVDLPYVEEARGLAALLSVHVYPEGALLVLVTPDLDVPPAHRAEVALLLADLNVNACPLGAFEMDADDGTLRFRLAYDLTLARPRPDGLDRLVDGLAARACRIVDEHLAKVVAGLATLSITDLPADD